MSIVEVVAERVMTEGEIYCGDYIRVPGEVLKELAEELNLPLNHLTRLLNQKELLRRQYLIKNSRGKFYIFEKSKVEEIVKSKRNTR
ncbi:hypothetical protein [Thermococcus sp. LS2]|uniref:hypothetical protein n=1 Tax=Thermococcus sp. LS2 TaxID=1638260 RepID=UPI00143BF3F9|nr:hypothetical protein [Thermococcus sp. LS2]NJE11997.1 hypothetical protein [Thermococcus sp. LS2]